jgi:hypothetical protein
MTILQLLPATLSLVLLAAHFLRSGSMILVLVALGLASLLLVRREWVSRVVQVALVIGAAEWLRTLVVLAEQRRVAGVPFARMAVILGAVAAFTLCSAALMRARRVELHVARARSSNRDD